MNAYVVRGERVGSGDFERIAQGLFETLRAGSARIGWSYDDRLDLVHIVRETNGGRWDQLDGDQQEAWYCHGFLDRATEGDLLFYPNVPSYGKFCVARVTGGYTFVPQNGGVHGDFRSSRPCALLTFNGIDKTDPIVPAIIRHKIGLQRRFYQLYTDQNILDTLLNDIPNASQAVSGARSEDWTSNGFREFSKMMRPVYRELARRWTTHFPAADLSTFLAGILARHGERVDLQEGPTEHGSDLVIEVSNDFLDRPIVVGVQVMSCEGSVSGDTVRRKLEQLIQGWKDNTLDYGALVLSGEWTAEADKVLAEHNQNNPQQRVKKVDGMQLAQIVTRLTWMEDR